jgi:hypothetical protein
MMYGHHQLREAIEVRINDTNTFRVNDTNTFRHDKHLGEHLEASEVRIDNTDERIHLRGT